MARIPLDPPPLREPLSSRAWIEWFRRLYERTSASSQILWVQLDTSSSELKDIGDVDASLSPTDGQVLSWNDSNSEWVASNPVTENASLNFYLEDGSKDVIQLSSSTALEFYLEDGSQDDINLVI